MCAAGSEHGDDIDYSYTDYESAEINYDSPRYFTAPTTDGNYEIRFYWSAYCYEEYFVLSIPFTVGNVKTGSISVAQTEHTANTSITVDYSGITAEMENAAVQFGKTNGVQLRHFIFSFDKYCQVSPQQVGQIAQSLAYFLGRKYQTVFAVHENTDNLHFHLISNAISFIDGHRYAGSKAEFYALQNYMKQVLRSYGISTLDIDE
ncbi:MAG: relaxase/mobilization nuclease domain-containing protein [Clostridia bacterium]|nr:relaxase/mobilization nuclease domain-containing protein [Clostridia bacterium]